MNSATYIWKRHTHLRTYLIFSDCCHQDGENYKFEESTGEVKFMNTFHQNDFEKGNMGVTLLKINDATLTFMKST
jgi:hypothetical protein